MTSHRAILHHEIRAADLAEMRADADLLLRTAKEIGPTTCQPMREHPLIDGKRRLANPALGPASIDVDPGREGGFHATMTLRSWGHPFVIAAPFADSERRSAVLDFPGAVVRHAASIVKAVAAEDVDAPDRLKAIVEQAGAIAWLAGGEDATLHLPTPWIGARLITRAGDAMTPGLAALVRERFGLNIHASRMVTAAGVRMHEIAAIQVDAVLPGIVDAMRIAADWGIER